MKGEVNMIDCLYDCFKHWVKNGSLYIYSDPHFGDEDCHKMDKNWIPPDEQVALINKVCHKNDTLLLLGDLGDPEYVKQIKANKVLVTGNHDKPGLYRDICSEIYNGVLVIAPQIIVSHEHLEGILWAINFHGHDHSGRHRWTDANGGKHVNMAANVCRWMPLNLGEEIKKGLISNIPEIHRLTIDKATTNSIKKKNREARKNGQPIIERPVRQPKQKTPPPVARPKDPNKRINKLRERYCLNCTNTQVKDPDALMHGACPLYDRKCYVVANSKLERPIRYVIDIRDNRNMKAYMDEFYKSHEKLDGDKFIPCNSCPEMVAVISSMGKEKEKADV